MALGWKSSVPDLEWFMASAYNDISFVAKEDCKYNCAFHAKYLNRLSKKYTWGLRSFSCSEFRNKCETKCILGVLSAKIWINIMALGVP